VGEPAELIHQSLRLRIMAALHAAERDRDAMAFTRLKRLVEATDGNLGSHLATLEKAGYASIEKEFVGRKPRTRVAITPTGRSAFRSHVAFIRDVIDSAG
jgi:DNA-binding MarR family transcriptional regulator